MLLCQGCRWIGKNTNKKFNCVMVLIVRPSRTLKFQFVFGFIECLWDFPYLIFKIFGFTFELWLYIYDFWFYNTNDFKSPLTSCRWIKKLITKTSNIYYEILRKIWKRKSSSILSESHKVHLLINIFYIYLCYGLNCSKNYLVIISLSSLRTPPH